MGTAEVARGFILALVPVGKFWPTGSPELADMIAIALMILGLLLLAASFMILVPNLMREAKDDRSVIQGAAPPGPPPSDQTASESH